jgi:microcystin degradation protein MlrC
MANDYSPARNDAALSPAAIALPAGSSTTVNSASIDLNAVGPFLAETELELVTASATLDSTALPNTETLTYTIQDSADDSSFQAVAVLSLATMTGAGGAGDTANTVYHRLASDTRRYVRVSVVSSGSAGDCSAATMTLKALF